MNRAERDQNIADYDSALQGLNIGDAQRDRVKQEAKNKADEYNRIVSGVLEPLGAEITKKPAENLIKRGVNKLVGKGSRALRSAGRDAVQDLREGRNPATRLADRARRTLDEVRSSARSARSQVEDLGDGARNFVNRSRQARGLRSIRTSSAQSREPLFPEASEREPSSGEGLRTQDLPTSNLDSDLPYRPTDARELIESFELPEVGDLGIGEPTLTRIGDGVGDDPFTNFHDNIVDGASTDNVGLGDAVSRINRLFRAQNPLADSGALDQTAPMRQATLNRATQSAPQASNPDGVARPTAEPEANDGGQAPRPARSLRARGRVLGDEPTPRAPTDDDAPTPASAGGSAELDALPEEIDASMGGPLDIFGDIISALAGVGVLIAGAVPSKKPDAPVVNVVNPSTQFGI